MKAVDKYFNKVMISLTLSEILGKKKEIKFFERYKPKYYFEIKPKKSGDLNG